MIAAIAVGEGWCSSGSGNSRNEWSQNLGISDFEVEGRTIYLSAGLTFDITYCRHGFHKDVLVAIDTNNSITTETLRPFNLDTTAWCSTECQRPKVQAQGIAHIAAQEEEQDHLYKP